MPTSWILLGAVPTWSANAINFNDIWIPALAMARIEAAAETASMCNLIAKSVSKYTDATASFVDTCASREIAVHHVNIECACCKDEQDSAPSESQSLKVYCFAKKEEKRTERAMILFRGQRSHNTRYILKLGPINRAQLGWWVLFLACPTFNRQPIRGLSRFLGGARLIVLSHFHGWRRRRDPSELCFG